jgi:hypothetical protein
MCWSTYKQAGAHQNGGLRSAASPKLNIKKNTDFVDMMISNVLRNLPYSQNQPLKSADD